jgi:PmbA protein
MNEVFQRTKEIVKKGKALGADEIIANTIFGEYKQIRFSNNQIDIGLAWNDYTTEILLTWRRRVVTTQIKNFQNSEFVIKRLLKLARVSTENPVYGGIAEGNFKYDKPSADKSVRSIEDPSEYIHGAIGAAEGEIGKNIESGGILSTGYEQVFLASSEGPEGIDERSAIELSIRAFSQRNASGHGVECASSIKDFNPLRAGKKAGEIAKMAINPRVGKTGKYDIIFDPLFWGSLMGVFGFMGSAYNVMIKMSVFTDKLKERVGPETLRILDNPRKRSVNRRIFDDEGIPIKKTVFIDKGILQTYFHNTSTANVFKAETTGHAGIIVPRPWSLEMDQGDMSKDEMIRDVKHGLYLTNTWYTRFQNYATGDFSTIPRDGVFLIENGEITQSWRQIRLSDNFLNIINSIEGISKERQQVHWWLEADPPSISPYVLAKSLQITKPK